MKLSIFIVKRQWTYLLLAVLFSLAQACKKDTDVDPGFGPNGEPRILAVTIPGIPDPNIYVNQDTKQIVVTVPTSYSARLIEPVLSLTPSTSLLSGQSYFLDAISDATRYPFTVRTTGNKLTTYALVLKPAGNLTFGAISGPQTYSISDQTTYVQIPVYNYVDGSGSQGNKVTLINQVSGERITPSVIYVAHEGIVDKKPLTDGAIMLNLYLNGFDTYYPPGQYTVELIKSNGRKATTTQAIQLLKGPTKGKFDVNYTLQLNSGEYLLYGSDFYRDDKISLRLQGPDQQSATIDALGFIDKQPGIRLPTSLNLKPGYYYAQLIVNGAASSSTGRISISDQVRPLIIEQLSVPDQPNLLGETYSLDTPITLTKGMSYSLFTNYFLVAPNDPKATRRVRLTLLADRSRTYDVPFGPTPVSSIDAVTLPDTIPSGRYEFTVQVIRSDGSVIDGLPLERAVVIP